MSLLTALNKDNYTEIWLARDIVSAYVTKRRLKPSLLPEDQHNRKDWTKSELEAMLSFVQDSTLNITSKMSFQRTLATHLTKTFALEVPLEDKPLICFLESVLGKLDVPFPPWCNNVKLDPELHNRLLEPLITGLPRLIADASANVDGYYLSVRLDSAQSLGDNRQRSVSELNLAR